MLAWRLKSALRAPFLQRQLGLEVAGLLLPLVVTLLLQTTVDLFQVEVSHAQKGFQGFDVWVELPVLLAIDLVGECGLLLHIATNPHVRQNVFS